MIYVDNTGAKVSPGATARHIAQSVQEQSPIHVFSSGFSRSVNISTPFTHISPWWHWCGPSRVQTQRHVLAGLSWSRLPIPTAPLATALMAMAAHETHLVDIAVDIPRSYPGEGIESKEYKMADLSTMKRCFINRRPHRIAYLTHRNHTQEFYIHPARQRRLPYLH